MSGVAKGIGKVFKKAADIIKPIAPIVIAGAAVYLTAGFAAPLVGSLSTALGGGVLGSVVATGATQAAIGAGVGGLTAGLTGGDVGKGALLGGATGAIMGGVSGYANAPGATTGLAGGAGGDPLIGGAGTDTLASVPSSGGPPPIGSGGLGAGGWLERNPIAGAALIQVGGQTIAGLGQGLMAGDPGEDALKRDREERKAIAANYGGGLVPGYTPFSDPGPGPSPTERWDPRRNYKGSWQYDPGAQRLVFVRGEQ